MWRRRGSIFDELEDMRAYMDSMFLQMGEPGRVPLLPSGEKGDLAVIPRSHMRVDVTEHDDKVIVTADMIPGIEKKDITVDLINPQALRISCERNLEKKVEKEGYYLHERRFGSMSRDIPLPKAVTEKGVTATFKNSVLEIQLKKLVKEVRTQITIE